MKKIKLFSGGILIGIINSLFGAGGGIIAVPLLRYSGLSQKNAQASSIAIILPLSVISGIMYLYKGYFNFTDALYFLPCGFIGAIVGTKLMNKASNRLLHYMFALLLIFSGIRLILK